MFKSFAIPVAPVEMSHEDFQAIIPAYAFGATDAEETRQVAEHVRRCRECRALLASYRALSDDMLYVAPGMPAPAGAGEGLQRRLAGGARLPAAVNRRGQVGARLAWSLAALALLAFVLTNVYWFSRMGRLEEQVAAQVAQLSGISTTPTTVLYADEDQPGRGVLYAASGNRLMLLCVYDMPELPEGRAYQVWLIRDGERDSGGLFRVSPKGYGLLLLDLARPLTEYEAVGITVEPAGGSPGPTSPRVIGGRL